MCGRGVRQFTRGRIKISWTNGQSTGQRSLFVISICSGRDKDPHIAKYDVWGTRLVADEFSAENGALTASMKLRRRVVAERYRQQIEEMYEQAEEAGPVTT